MGLNAEQIRQFHEIGFVVVDDVYSDSDLRPLRDGLTAAIQQKCDELIAKGDLDRDFAEEPFETRLSRIYHHDNEAGHEVIMSIWSGKYHGAGILDALRHPPLIECIQDLVGPDVMGTSIYRVRPKVPGYSQAEVPWHQDSGYGMAHCDDFLVVTCWIPLVDVDAGNGCLWVVPKVYHDGIIRHYSGGKSKYLEITPEDVPEGAIPIEIRTGSALLLTNMTPHASFENVSDVVRWSIDLRYQDFDVPSHRNETPEDYTPERDPVTMACNPGEAYLVVRDTKHPENEVKDPEDFAELREVWDDVTVKTPGRWTSLADRS